MIENKEFSGKGIRLSLIENAKEIGHCYLYLLHNDLHTEPFGLLEDVFVLEEHRGQGNGKKLVLKAIEVAREKACYKLVFTSRYDKEKVHAWYEEMGFKDTSKGFRMDF